MKLFGSPIKIQLNDTDSAVRILETHQFSKLDQPSDRKKFGKAKAMVRSANRSWSRFP